MRNIGVTPVEKILEYDGLGFLRAIIDGTLPKPPIADMAEGLWLLTHSDLRATARVRAFMDFAGAEIAKQRKQLEGAG